MMRGSLWLMPGSLYREVREKKRREIADSLRAEINVFLDVIFEMLLL